MAERGLRVLAVADRLLPGDHVLSGESAQQLIFRGLLAFRDPVRPTAKKALFDLKRGGLRPLMITGDHPSTALAIAMELELSKNPQVLTGVELSAMDEDQLLQQIERIDVFARVSPSQKVRIVRALSKKGKTVAMVGDGANDAPAIRLASVGVAMGQNCAEAARNAADIVLADARVETLVEAIIEGRALWEAVRDAVSILVGGNLGEIGFTLLGGLVSGRPPLSPRQLLLVNLFTDVAPATALAIRKPAEDSLAALSERGPEASMGWRLDRDIGARALVTATGAGAAWVTSSLVGDRRGASTTALLALVGTQLGQTMSTGERSRQVVVTNVLSALGLAIIVQTPGLSGAFGCRPLGPLGWTIATGASTLATLAGRYVPDLLEDLAKDGFMGAIAREEGLPEPAQGELSSVTTG
jgi:cation-transporting ATPase I